MLPDLLEDGAPLVYDVGAAEGDDCAYYLDKGCRVVAIEANATMVALCRARFADAIDRRQIAIVPYGVGDRDDEAVFHVNCAEPAISTFLPEKWAGRSWVRNGWAASTVRIFPLSTLVRHYGDPWYVKIDVEFYDLRVLSDLTHHAIQPPYISVEVQELAVFDALCGMGYDRFQLVVGETIPQHFADCEIRTVDGAVLRRDFPASSTGPFGDDLPAAGWLDLDAARALLFAHGEGWIDVHARIGDGR